MRKIFLYIIVGFCALVMAACDRQHGSRKSLADISIQMIHIASADIHWPQELSYLTKEGWLADGPLHEDSVCHWTYGEKDVDLYRTPKMGGILYTLQTNYGSYSSRIAGSWARAVADVFGKQRYGTAYIEMRNGEVKFFADSDELSGHIPSRDAIHIERSEYKKDSQSWSKFIMHFQRDSQQAFPYRYEITIFQADRKN